MGLHHSSIEGQWQQVTDFCQFLLCCTPVNGRKLLHQRREEMGQKGLGWNALAEGEAAFVFSPPIEQETTALQRIMYPSRNWSLTNYPALVITAGC